MVRLPCIFFVAVSLLLGTSVLANPIYLKQSDFDNGTYIITEPGEYRLAEDITFNPNSPSFWGSDAYGSSFLARKQYTSHGGKYDDANYGLGFFSAIAIAADNVIFDLDGHTIEQSPEHALLMRFFAVIELANQPFIPGQGPHNFGNQLKSARRVVIRNGTIGLSAHHGIHGNGNEDVVIEKIAFNDFEVAAVALNGVNGLTIQNCTAKSRIDVPVLGTYSGARFIQPYLDYLVENNSKTTLNIGQKKVLTATEARDRLRQGVNAVYEDVITKGGGVIDNYRHPEEYALFHNKARIIDGNCYGFLINAFGQAVEGFPVKSRFLDSELSKNIRFKDVHVKRLHGKINEIISFRDGEKAVVDPVGAVFQIKNGHPDTGKPITVSSWNDKEAVYTGNLLSNAQAIVAKAYLNGEFDNSGLDVSRLNISQKVIDWIEADPKTPQAKLSSLVSRSSDYLCNADSMFHVNKGVIAFKVDAATNVILDGTTATNILNLSEVGSDICGHYIISHPKATLTGCGGPKARAYSFAGSSNVRVYDCVAKNLEARCGSAVGFDILTDSSDVVFHKCSVDQVKAGGEFVHNNAPNDTPEAIGFLIGSSARNVTLRGVCGQDLKGRGGEFPVLDKSRRARVSVNCIQ